MVDVQPAGLGNEKWRSWICKAEADGVKTFPKRCECYIATKTKSTCPRALEGAADKAEWLFPQSRGTPVTLPMAQQVIEASHPAVPSEESTIESIVESRRGKVLLTAFSTEAEDQ